MSIVVVTPPAAQPVTLAEAKSHLRVGHDDDDAEIGVLIATASESVARMLGRALLPQTLELRLSAFPPGEIVLPRPPLREVVSVTYLTSSGTETPLAGEAFRTAGIGPDTSGTIEPVTTWPATLGQREAVRVRFVAGYDGAADDFLVGEVPAPVRSAILLKIGLLFHPHDERTAAAIEASIEALLSSYGIFA